MLWNIVSQDYITVTVDRSDLSKVLRGTYWFQDVFWCNTDITSTEGPSTWCWNVCEPRWLASVSAQLWQNVPHFLLVRLPDHSWHCYADLRYYRVLIGGDGQVKSWVVLFSGPNNCIIQLHEKSTIFQQ